MPSDEPHARRSRFRGPAVDAGELPPLAKGAPPDPAKVDLVHVGEALKKVLGDWAEPNESLLRIGEAMKLAEGNRPTFGEIGKAAELLRDRAAARDTDLGRQVTVLPRGPSREVLAINALQAEIRKGNAIVGDQFEAIVLQSKIAERQERSARFSGRIIIALTIVIAIFTVVIAGLTWVLVQRPG